MQTFGDSVINTSVTIGRFLDIDDSELTFTLLFTVRLEWFDDNLKFLFLKDYMMENIVNEDMKKQIWNPEVMVLVPDPRYQHKISEYLTVRKEGEPKLSHDNDKLFFNETYHGSQNSFVKDTYIQSKFICSFNKIQSYPFGVQTCTINIFLKGSDEFRIKMVAKNLSLFHDSTKLLKKGDDTYEVGQYFVKSWSLYNTEKGNTVTLELNMIRSLFKIFMVTYLPTILMNVMNQAVVYIRTENKFDLIITVNITCMMVLASMYLSVSSSLPSTANIKPIEIWLLVNLIYPVFVIISNVIVQVSIYYKNGLKHH